MSGVIEQMQSWPWFWAWTGFFAVAVLRAGGTYLIGRGVTAGVIRWRPPSERVLAMMDRVGRWGPPAVTLSFLTVGVQTAVNLAAGLMAMPWPRYLLGLVPGAAVWASIWSTIGMAAFLAAVVGLRGEPWVFVGLAAVILLIGAFAWRSRRRDDSS
ncbi:DedA family protein [uncultured Aeromicrobium sp.]|uniref:DedA family protein n=1 Tax=uncultured Aeromicrobium sp. TaxID=337820 RepID=UPI0025DC969C|nr:VTT domain-containing protein [uncultured Aeromicrobium sp.]